ncbi:DUF7344 domain-containing protein [Haladaptatus caseinilyticus]
MVTDSYGNPETDENAQEQYLDLIFDVLASKSRQYALAYLRSCSHPVEIADVAAEIAAQKQQTSRSELPENLIEREYIALLHKHLPKLKQLNFVYYRRDQSTISCTTAIQSIEPFLELILTKEQKSES